MLGEERATGAEGARDLRYRQPVEGFVLEMKIVRG
jgi:hypothetical protein